MQQALPLDGQCCGPLFAPVSKTLPSTHDRRGALGFERVRRATPAWAEHSAIRTLYQWARVKTWITGELWVVDHIVPKINPYVCGLHVRANLRVIRAVENTAKANLWWPDMPEIQLDLLPECPVQFSQY